MALCDRQSSKSILCPRMPKQKWQLLSATKLYTSTLDTDVLRMTNNDATNYTSKWQETSIIFLGCWPLYANYPFSQQLLDSWSKLEENILWVCLTLQCSVNCCTCCAVDNCTYCVYQNHPNITNCLPVSATLRSLLAVSTSPCITASTTASLSLTPARAPVEDQVTFDNEQKIIKQHSQLSYIYYNILYIL